MRAERISMEDCARLLAAFQPNISPAMAIAQAQVPISLVRFGVAPMWSLGATACTINENGATRHQVDINLGSWLVLGQKLNNPIRTGVRHLPDGRIAKFSIDADGVAEIIEIFDGESEIMAFVGSQNSWLSQVRVNTDVEICILFILLHELGHCYFEHGPPNQSQPLMDYNHSVEHQADLFGLKQLLIALRHDNVKKALKIFDLKDCNILIATGRSIAIMIGALCEQECFRLHHASHPPARARVTFLVGAVATLDLGFTEYERSGLIAGLMDGLEDWPEWYEKKEIKKGTLHGRINNILTVFKFHSEKETSVGKFFHLHRGSRGATRIVARLIRWLRNFLWVSARFLFP